MTEKHLPNVETNTDNGKNSYVETVEDRYRRCGFQNSIQHIDIYGGYRTNYVEKKHTDNFLPTAVTCISTCSKKFNGGDTQEGVNELEAKLNKFSVITKISGLYPGNDILSKSRKLRKSQLFK